MSGVLVVWTGVVDAEYSGKWYWANMLTCNNYAIVNESRTKTAKIFFAQGCEVDAMAEVSQ
ncbi:mitotic fidelity of chromosome transmission-related protein [Elasticomyces elasticus]|nr:mitotic fidelity of chromosome transmission-related protein [Elasticomyces elasticus]KAK4979974.1 mitotic fidelity of chromosome transmission- protein [Elasticomyces elasticus]